MLLGGRVSGWLKSRHGPLGPLGGTQEPDNSTTLKADNPEMVLSLLGEKQCVLQPNHIFLGCEKPRYVGCNHGYN